MFTTIVIKRGNWNGKFSYPPYTQDFFLFHPSPFLSACLKKTMLQHTNKRHAHKCNQTVFVKGAHLMGNESTWLDRNPNHFTRPFNAYIIPRHLHPPSALDRAGGASTWHLLSLSLVSCHLRVPIRKVKHGQLVLKLTNK